MTETLRDAKTKIESVPSLAQVTRNHRILLCLLPCFISTVSITMPERQRRLSNARNMPKLVSVSFEEGPLGVTLRRNADGVVFVFAIVEGTQAVNMDIRAGDELWSIGESLIEDTRIDKEAWDALVQYIKHASRPLKATWVRKNDETDMEEERHTRKISVETLENEHHHDVDSEREDEDDDEDDDDDDEDEEFAIDLNGIDSLINEVTITAPPPSRRDQSDDHIPTPRRMSSTTSNSSSTPEPRPESPPLCDPDLIDLANRLVLKDKDTQSVVSVFNSLTRRRAATSDAAAVAFIKEGRRVLKTGELTTTSKGAISLFNAQTKFFFFLMTDILVVATPISGPKGQKMYQVEDVIDLLVCKLSHDVDTDNSDSALFQVLWPGGTLQVSAKTSQDKMTWVDAIVEAICACVTSRDSSGRNGPRSIGNHNNDLESF